MNSYPTPTRFDLAQSKALQTESKLQLVVFRIGNLKLALRIEVVYKVVPFRSVHGSGLNSVGIAHVDHFEVTVIDLHQRLFKSSPKSSPVEEAVARLIVAISSSGELYGLPTAETPTLLEIPLSRIRVLPESYRRSDTLDIASHVAVVPQSGSTLTIFLIDGDRSFLTPQTGHCLLHRTDQGEL
ncbi:MAG: chemotaxis protein CheW [Leptolyngbyaceae cyanobacterium SL_5_9]|nr:chemotaxis protein CheW [Leptolyngbyaceae cyanobacterium SL_5_9]NJO76520.1 chemotaxis protein CheW [Leptolyngbyaceae cyanobacterium RM1_406_9]